MQALLKAAAQPAPHVKQLHALVCPCEWMGQILAACQVLDLSKEAIIHSRAKMSNRAVVVTWLPVVLGLGGGGGGVVVSGDSMYMEISVQPMDRMLPATAVEADVFSFADDLPMSMHVAIGSKDRGRILQWDHVGPSSSYDNCISLREPKPIQPVKTTLLDLPTLSIRDRLDASGWDGESRKTKHILEGAKVYDNRRPVSSRRYYQCLLVLDELLLNLFIVETRKHFVRTFFDSANCRLLGPQRSNFKQS